MTMTSQMARIKRFFIDNWPSKLATLLVAIAVWYMIKRHLDAANPSFPVPGAGGPPASRPSTTPIIEPDFFSPLVPPIPGVPGREG